MKQKVTSILLAFMAIFFCIQNASAQTNYPEFAPVGAMWRYQKIEGGVFGPAFYSIDTLTSIKADTVLGQPCKDLGNFYAYRDSLKMYIYRKNIDSGWKLFLDFGWHAGDTVTIPTMDGHYPSALTNIPVSYSGDTVVNSDTLPMLRFNNGYFSAYAILNYSFTNEYFLPQVPYPPVTDGALSYTLRCYEDTVVGLVKMAGVGNCDTVYLGVNEIQKQMASFKLYPNPCNNEISLQPTTPSVNTMTIIVYNTFGQKVFEQTLSDNNLSINTSGWTSGFYYYVLSNKQEIFQKGSFIVAH